MYLRIRQRAFIQPASLRQPAQKAQVRQLALGQQIGALLIAGTQSL